MSLIIMIKTLSTVNFVSIFNAFYFLVVKTFNSDKPAKLLGLCNMTI